MWGSALGAAPLGGGQPALWGTEVEVWAKGGSPRAGCEVPSEMVGKGDIGKTNRVLPQGSVQSFNSNSAISQGRQGACD